jgi:hypothetical protein
MTAGERPDGEDFELRTYHERDPVPPGLEALATLQAQAAAAGLKMVAVTHPNSPPALQALARRRHDLKAALRTLGHTVKALEGGYTFQDDLAGAKIAAIAKATKVLERAGAALERLLATDY